MVKEQNTRKVEWRPLDLEKTYIVLLSFNSLHLCGGFLRQESLACVTDATVISLPVLYEIIWVFLKSNPPKKMN